MTHVIDGHAVAADVRDGLEDSLVTLEAAGVTPGLATVLLSDDPASQTYISMKQRACAAVGIDGKHLDLDPSTAAAELSDTITTLNEDPDVHGIFVQLPVPDHVDGTSALRSIAPRKDIDGFHPENIGRLVAGDPRYKPCTPHGIQKLLEAADVDTAGKDAVIVGRSDIVGKPMANLLIQTGPGGNATTTVCHSKTTDLAAKTREADIVIAAAGVPELVDGSMIGEGAVVIDVGVNRVASPDRRSADGRTASAQSNGETSTELVGDVEFESAVKNASVITPVPGGVGPMTIAMVLSNTVEAAAIQEDVSIPLTEDR